MRKETEKNRKAAEKRAISLVEISIMIISTFAFAFIIAETSNVFGGGVGIASAQTATPVTCCERSVNGTWCYESASESECNSNYMTNPNALCSETSFCRLGCCYDSNEGTCSRNSPETLCEESNGEFTSNNADCNLQQCTQGCCLIGDNANYVTEQQCKRLAEYNGVDYSTQAEFTSANNELECLVRAGLQEQGACVFEDSDGESACTFGTKLECTGSSGIRYGYEFYNGMMCTAPSLNTICQKTENTICVEGKDETYFIDSCGNTANIYDASKIDDEAYWTYYYTKEQSCGAGATDGNANSASCGNCDYLAGSKCKGYRTGKDTKPDYGNYVCRDLDCPDTSDGTDRWHGESWCEYDGSIGNGTDIVGSRHWRHYCIEGEEKVEPCDDFRQSICAEQQTQAADSSMFSSAACVYNDWRSCLSYNEETGTAEENCKANPHCFWQAGWDPGEEWDTINMCLPQYPPGNYLASTTEGTAFSAAAECSLATQSVTVTEVKECRVFGLFGSDWECKANCIADEEGWTQAMNKWCTSLGDCGAYVNIAGVVTDGGYNIEGGQKLSDSYLDSLVQNIIPNPEIKGLVPRAEYSQDAIDSGAMMATGALGVGVLALSLWEFVTPHTISEFTTFVMGGEATGLAAFGQFVGSALSVYAVGQILGMLAGMTGDEANTLSYIGVAAYAGVYVFGEGGISAGGGTIFSLGAFAWAVIVMVVLAIISYLAGCNDTREHTVSFTCSPWQPPTGGADCSKCNDELAADGLHECSEYRCSSLGAACRLKDSAGSNVCWWENQNDVASPVITPWEDVLGYGYEYASTASCPTACANEIRNTLADDECVPPFTPFSLGITTDEPANCRLDSESTDSFDDMQESFSGGAYLQQHATTLSMPGWQNILDEANITELPIEAGQENRVYIRCQDFNGNSNVQELVFEFCVSPEPDGTPPLIRSVEPPSGSGVAFGTSSKNIDVFVNEPSECKWSRNDMEFDFMENSMYCDTSVAAMQPDGSYKCLTALDGIEAEQDNQFYFRCKDRPFASNDSERNAMSTSYSYVLKGTSSLNITSTSPQGTITTGIEPISIELDVRTIGGMDNGNAECSYSRVAYLPVWFFETGGTVHQQQLSLIGGNYSYNISCTDAAENTASSKIEFNISVDNTAPSVVRVYYDGGVLKVITNEEALCRYSTNATIKCAFSFDDAVNSTAMSVINTKTHTASWAENKDYYIKCKDAFGNNPGSNVCNIEARAVDLTP